MFGFVHSIKLEQSSHSVLGYINPNGFLPSPVITIIEENKVAFAVFPDLALTRIIDFWETEESINNLEKANEHAKISNGQYSYCIEKGVYLTDSPLNILLKLLDIFSAKTELHLNQHHREIVKEYVVNEDLKRAISQSPLDYDTCLHLSKYLPVLRIVLNKRTKKNKEIASRILIQYLYSKQLRTVFNKNISYTKDVNAIDFKPKTLKSLINAVTAALKSNSLPIEPIMIPNLAI